MQIKQCTLIRKPIITIRRDSGAWLKKHGQHSTTMIPKQEKVFLVPRFYQKPIRRVWPIKYAKTKGRSLASETLQPRTMNLSLRICRPNMGSSQTEASALLTSPLVSSCQNQGVERTHLLRLNTCFPWWMYILQVTGHIAEQTIEADFQVRDRRFLQNKPSRVPNHW